VYTTPVKLAVAVRDVVALMSEEIDRRLDSLWVYDQCIPPDQVVPDIAFREVCVAMQSDDSDDASREA
jgi:hypothetical protein